MYFYLGARISLAAGLLPVPIIPALRKPGQDFCELEAHPGLHGKILSLYKFRAGNVV